MNKITAFFVLLFFLSACKKTIQTELAVHNSITGKWLLSDYYGSPGGGVDLNAIPWVPVSPSNANFIQFNPDGTFVNSQDLNLLKDHYTKTDSTLTIVRQGRTVTLGFKLASPYLSLYGNLSFDAMCIEFCGTRYISSR